MFTSQPFIYWSSKMFNVNQYFDGKVASIAFAGEQLAATVGVMAAGSDDSNKRCINGVTAGYNGLANL
jgi:hypothetical protein